MADSPALEFYPSTQSTSRQRILAAQVKQLQDELDGRRKELEERTSELEAARGELLCCRSIAQAAIFARQEQVAALRQNIELLTMALADARDKSSETTAGLWSPLPDQDAERKRRAVERERQKVERERQKLERERQKLEAERTEVQAQRRGLEDVDSSALLAAARDRWEADRAEGDRRLRDELIKEIEADLQVTRQEQSRSPSRRRIGDVHWSSERVLAVRIFEPPDATSAGGPSLVPGSPSSESALVLQLRSELEQALRVQEVLRNQLSIAQRISSINNYPQRERISEATQPPAKKANRSPSARQDDEEYGAVPISKAPCPSKPSAKRSSGRTAAAATASTAAAAAAAIVGGTGKRTRRGRVAGVGTVQDPDGAGGTKDAVTESPTKI